jgi:hypothetical protein
VLLLVLARVRRRPGGMLLGLPMTRWMTSNCGIRPLCNVRTGNLPGRGVLGGFPSLLSTSVLGYIERACDAGQGAQLAQLARRGKVWGCGGEGGCSSVPRTAKARSLKGWDGVLGRHGYCCCY